MQKHNYTIIDTPIGLIAPIWINKPRFCLIRLCVIDTQVSVTHMLDELDGMRFSNSKKNYCQQFIQDFNNSNRVEALENLFNGYSIFEKTSHDHVKELMKSLDLYFSSKINIEFPSEFLYLEKFSNFTRNVLLTLKNIPFGQTLSYAHLAELTGHPKAFRAVGTVMNKNPFPLIIPCHRVIRSDGNIGEFALGTDMKKYLLQHESAK
jgi:O-6-methylguanine DNA methyltransferase